MDTITVSTTCESKTYPVLVGNRNLKSLGALIPLDTYSKIIVVGDVNAWRHHEEYVRKCIPQIHTVIQISSGEEFKTIETIQKIWGDLCDARVDRKSLIINIGGGVVGDMGGFAASTYMRGIDFVQIPTTLLSMVDASVGGKTGINYRGVKNLVGSFQQPIAVLADTHFLSTLPDREFRSGLGEMIKHGLINSALHLEHLRQIPMRMHRLDNQLQGQLPALIHESIRIKKHIVEQDPTEQGVRKILNFGHTVGHAVESHSHTTDSPLTHGEAVAIGMVAESLISEKLGYGVGLSKYVREVLQSVGLPTSYKDAKAEEVYSIIQSDKKNISGKILFALLTKVGECAWNVEVETQVVKDALEQISV